MRLNKFALLISLSALLAFAACSQNDGTARQGANTPPGQESSGAGPGTSTKSPPADVVKASAETVEVKTGGSAEASVKLSIASGYHINANPPSFSYLKATELQVEPGEGLTAGKPVYPASVTRKFAFSNDPLAVYEGEAVIKLPVEAAADAKKGAQTLKAKLRVQACDDEACYPPRTFETSIPVTVK